MARPKKAPPHPDEVGGVEDMGNRGASAVRDADIRCAIGILARYLTERDQIKPHGPDSAIYRLAEEFGSHAQESD